MRKVKHCTFTSNPRSVAVLKHHNHTQPLYVNAGLCFQPWNRNLMSDFCLGHPDNITCSTLIIKGTPGDKHGDSKDLGGHLSRQSKKVPLESLDILHKEKPSCILSTEPGIPTDSNAYARLLQVCIDNKSLVKVKSVHGCMLKIGFRRDTFIWNRLVDTYTKCECLVDARQAFDKMVTRDVISWNTMIVGYAQNGHASEALMLFRQMQLVDVAPDSVTMVSVLLACAHLGGLQQGKWIHGYIIKSGFESDVFVGTSLIDMYAKCGKIEIACDFFDKMSERNEATWSAMIGGYAMHGHGESALALFTQMQQIGIKPNHITFICVLLACSHAGLVDEGWQYFYSMSQDYSITPRVEHYACMVDILGRAGHLDEAQVFVKKMPIKPNVGVWGALLGACRIHSNIDLGECVAECLFDLEPQNAGFYVLLSNIYAAGGRWDDVGKMRRMMKDRGLRKTPGCSWIELNNRVHSFLVGDRSHPQSEKIYAMLEILGGQMKEAGYVPKTNFVLHNVDE